MGLRDFIGSRFSKNTYDNSEFDVCWDLSFIDHSSLVDSKTKTAYYLQYSRAAIHFVSYINKLEFIGEGSSETFLEISTSLFDSLICMARISGLSSKEIHLKKFFDFMLLNDKITLDGEPIIKNPIRDLSLHEITVFMWHNLIVGETSTPWFSLSGETECDWQSIRDNLVILFSLFTSLCCKLDINFETICSHFVKRCRSVKDNNND